MIYLNREDFLKENEKMQLSGIIYNTEEVLNWEPAEFMQNYKKWMKFNEEELVSDCYGHATVSCCTGVREMLWNLRFLYANEKGIPGPFEGVYPESFRPNIFGDDIASVEKWNFSRANLNEKNRIMAITQVASICYQSGKSLGSESLYNRLLAESHGLPSSSFEFVPMLISDHDYEIHVNSKLPKSLDINNQLTKFGEWIEDNGKKYLLTNFRAAVYMKEYYPDIDLTLWYNTESECKIIENHFNVFLYKVDFPTRSQMVRHRVCWQELSRRYVSGKRVPFEFYISEGMKKVTSSNRFIDGLVGTDDIIESCLEHYYAALEQGIKPQEARRIIPQVAYTQIWGAFQPSQLENFFRLRLDEHAQWEIRKVAEAMKYSEDKGYPIQKPLTKEQEEENFKRLEEIASGNCKFIHKEEISNLLGG